MIIKGQQFIYNRSEVDKQITFTFADISPKGRVKITWHNEYNEYKEMFFAMTYILEQFKKNNWTLLKQKHFDDNLFTI